MMSDDSDQNITSSSSSSASASSSDEEREDGLAVGQRMGGSRSRVFFETPLKSLLESRSISTPSTVTEMTPSPTQLSLSYSVSSHPGTEPPRSSSLSMLESSIPTPRIRSTTATTSTTTTISSTSTPTSSLSYSSSSAFRTLQQQREYDRGDLSIPTNLFPDTPTTTSGSHRRRSKRRSLPVHRSRLSESLLLDGYSSPSLLNYRGAGGIEKRKSSSVTSSSRSRDGSSSRHHKTSPPTSAGPTTTTTCPCTTEPINNKGSPDIRTQSQSYASTKFDVLPQWFGKHPRWKTVGFLWCTLVLSLTCSLEMILLTRATATGGEPDSERVLLHELSHPDGLLFSSSGIAGLRGKMTSGHWEEKYPQHPIRHPKKETLKDATSILNGKESPTKKKHKVQPSVTSLDKQPTSKQQQVVVKSNHHRDTPSNDKTKAEPAAGSHHHDLSTTTIMEENLASPAQQLLFHFPPSGTLPKKPKFNVQDRKMYSSTSTTASTTQAKNVKKNHPSYDYHRRVVSLDPFFQTISNGGPPRVLKLYPADVSDNTQLYSILDSSDERLSHMEPRVPYSDGECIPMKEWQTTFYPLCNGIHELGMEHLGGSSVESNNSTVRVDNNNMMMNDGIEFDLVGTQGFWRYAWKLIVPYVHTQDTLVLKTLKYNHNFEDAHFEHDRIDAVAMERLTASKHVINAFGFCGHSVLTEYADGKRVGELADKAKKIPLARLRIASDIAHGLADVHGIDGDGNTTFVHFDVNLANVVSIDGTLKLNDFNIGIIRRWNTTSNTPCGFPAKYPNPQWRSPEEAREENNLTEKVDVFSLGHIFFRLICGHEPWNKLEPGGRPSKEEVSLKVQKGILPYIPDFVRTTDDPETIAIRDAMLACYTFDPIQRPSARHIANTLDEALEALAQSAEFNTGIGIDQKME